MITLSGLSRLLNFNSKIQRIRCWFPTSWSYDRQKLFAHNSTQFQRVRGQLSLSIRVHFEYTRGGSKCIRLFAAFTFVWYAKSFVKLFRSWWALQLFPPFTFKVEKREFVTSEETKNFRLLPMTSITISITKITVTSGLN